MALQAASVVARARSAGELSTLSGTSFRLLIHAPIFLLPKRPRATSGRSKSSSPVVQSDFPCRKISNVLFFISLLLVSAHWSPTSAARLRGLASSSLSRHFA
ncbi:MAG: hypothetical protein AW12_02426 [Candidatus Accumulibacter sp. BA-94]|nr:MAG: hypothetical protein AW12_02426 [Candidatus Accumulibacter sp. BA-94]